MSGDLERFVDVGEPGPVPKGVTGHVASVRALTQAALPRAVDHVAGFQRPAVRGARGAPCRS